MVSASILAPKQPEKGLPDVRICSTGAAGGIGLRIAERLVSEGFFVYAGVFIGGPVTDVSVEETMWLFDVNVFGVYRVTRAFAPLIIESKGRISTVGSISGIGSSRFFSQYSMSKHAMEAFSDSLALEMKRFGVEVSVIEPGNYDSKIVETAWKRMQEKSYIDEDSPYAADLKAFMEWPADQSIYKEPDEVADAAMHAMFSDKPKRRYMTVTNLSRCWTKPWLPICNLWRRLLLTESHCSSNICRHTKVVTA